jgi:hypothetical protein
MTNFFDFLESDKIPAKINSVQSINTPTPLSSSAANLSGAHSATEGAVARCLSKVALQNNIALSSVDVSKFSQKVTDLAYSKQFLSEFSDTVGLPKKEETEEQFVAKAKIMMASLLKKRLSE